MKIVEEPRRVWLCHALVFAAQSCLAILIGHRVSCECIPSPPLPPQEMPATFDVSPLMDAWAEMDEHVEGWNSPANASASGRRLVANDFNADFSRRLAFHTWIEEDVALDRRGLERYLRRALAASGIARARTERGSRTQRAHSPKSAEALQREYGTNQFAFDPAFAAQAHHMLPGAPWSHGRDAFMRLVRNGLRPNHYVLSLGCGPLATGHHVVRYLMTGRYHCVEPDEYLLRAAVEYEIPSKALIHKRPRFILNDFAEVASIMRKPPAWLPSPPSYFDLVHVERPLEPDELEKTITSAARYLRPRSGRLVVSEPLPARIQRQLGLQPNEQNEEQLSVGCPFSLRCSMHVYST
jgi:hypothetical protein